MFNEQKNATNQTDELITLQQKKKLGQKQETINFKNYPITWISTKAQNILTPINKKPYVTRENKVVKEHLKNLSITTSQSTAQRIDKDINKILTESETRGTNSRGVATLLNKKYKDLTTWEAQRIARTEINSVNNYCTYDRLLNSNLVDYVQWVSAKDSRVRTSHRKLNTQITRLGQPFSNGLLYPGDRRGPLEEYINCRCTIIPYIPDYDKIAPTDKTIFYERDMQQLPKNTGQQITLQLQENIKLYTVMEGYMKLYPDKVTIKPKNVQTTLNNVFQENQYTLTNLIKLPIDKIKSKTKSKIADMKTHNISTSVLVDRSTSPKLKSIPIDYTIKPSGNPIPTFIKQLTKNEYYTKKINGITYYVIKKSKIDTDGNILYNQKILNLISQKFNAIKQHTGGINTPEGATYKHTLGSRRFNIFFSKCYNPITKEWNVELIEKYRNMKKIPSKIDDEIGHVLFKVINSNLMDQYIKRANSMSKNIRYVQGNIMVSAGTKDISIINVEGKTLREIKEGDIIHLATFQSTTIEESVTDKFSEGGHPPTVVHICLHDGSPIIPALKNSDKPEEQEIIMLMGMPLKRVGRIERKNGKSHIYFELMLDKLT